jgi:hypothetical protein
MPRMTSFIAAKKWNKKSDGFHDSLPFENSPPNCFRASLFVTDQLKGYFRHAVCNQSVLL